MLARRNIVSDFMGVARSPDAIDEDFGGDTELKGFTWWVVWNVHVEWAIYRAVQAAQVQMVTKPTTAIAKAERELLRLLEQRGSEADLVRAQTLRLWLEDEKKPRRRSPRRSSRFPEFLECLLYSVRNFAAPPSFNRKNASGDVIDLLEFLRPLMPPGLIPNALPLPLIERICTRARARPLLLGDALFKSAPRTFLASKGAFR